MLLCDGGGDGGSGGGGGGVGVGGGGGDGQHTSGSGTAPVAPAAAVVAAAAAFGARAWDEEAPQTQLNGGSDPVVVTASHVVYRGGGGGSGGGGGGVGGNVPGEEAPAGSRARPSSAGGGDGGKGGGAAASGYPRTGGRTASEGARLRIKVYNATNTRLQGFSIRLGFGQGGEAVGMSDGGRVEFFVDEVCCFVDEMCTMPVCLFLCVWLGCCFAWSRGGEGGRMCLFCGAGTVAILLCWVLCSCDAPAMETCFHRDM